MRLWAVSLHLPAVPSMRILDIIPFKWELKAERLTFFPAWVRIQSLVLLKLSCKMLI